MPKRATAARAASLSRPGGKPGECTPMTRRPAGAFAAQVNTYSVTASTSPTRAGTKAKPVPVSIKFNYQVGEQSGQEPAAVKRYKISFYGIRSVNGALFKKCSAAKIAAAGNDDSGCPKGSQVGSGTVASHVYN